MKSFFLHGLHIKHISSVKDHCIFKKGLDLFKIRRSEFIPLCSNDQRICIFKAVVLSFGIIDLVTKKVLYVIYCFRIKSRNCSSFCQEGINDLKSRSFADIISVWLEGK